MTNSTPNPTDYAPYRMSAPIATLRVPPGMPVKDFLDLMDEDYNKALTLSQRASTVATITSISSATAAQD